MLQSSVKKQVLSPLPARLEMAGISIRNLNITVLGTTAQAATNIVAVTTGPHATIVFQGIVYR